VIRPDALTAVANRLGVGRGADLLLYVLAVGVLALGLHVYARFGDLEDRIVALARQVALADALDHVEDAGRPDGDAGGSR
jgi:hypothetical protein